MNEAFLTGHVISRCALLPFVGSKPVVVGLPLHFSKYHSLFITLDMDHKAKLSTIDHPHEFFNIMQ